VWRIGYGLGVREEEGGYRNTLKLPSCLFLVVVCGCVFFLDRRYRFYDFKYVWVLEEEKMREKSERRREKKKENEMSSIRRFTKNKQKRNDA